MGAEALVERMWAIHGGLNAYRIRAGFLSDREMALAESTCRDSESWSLWIDDAPRITMSHITATAKRFAAKHEHALIVIDYLQLIKPERRGSSRDAEVAEISREIKALSREIKCPVLCLCQLNRESEKEKDPYKLLNYLRESGSIEQDADVIMALTPADTKHEDNPIVLLTVAKHRNGPTGQVKLRFNKGRQRFEELAKEGDGDCQEQRTILVGEPEKQDDLPELPF
jgi:replicative DNA helicase